MIPSCTICKKRKKRCDFDLPSCKYCVVMGTHCEYYDVGLGYNVPREYLKSLNDNIFILKNQIEKYKSKIDRRSTENDPESLTTDEKPYEIVKNGTLIEGSALSPHYFGPCSLISMIRMSSIMLELQMDSFQKIYTINYESVPPIKISFDYGMITSDHSKILISNYITNIYPEFPLISESFFHNDIMIKNYPDNKQLFIFLILLVSSAHLTKKRLDFVPIKIMLQQKVVELMKPKLCHNDGDSLLSLLLYSLFELMDPSTGNSAWKVLSLACTIAERLQLRNLNDNIELPGAVASTIPRSHFLKVLVSLETEVSISLGNSPTFNLSENQVLTIQNDSLRKFFTEQYQKDEFYGSIFADSSECKIGKIIQNSESYPQDNYNLWLIASPLLSHKCSDCEEYFNSFVMLMLNSSIGILDKYSKQKNHNNVTLYWIVLTNVSISVINLILIKKFFFASYAGTTKEVEMMEYIALGQKLILNISSTWYYSNFVRSYIELALSKLE